MKLLHKKLLTVFVSCVALVLVFISLFYAYLQFSTERLPVFESSPLRSYMKEIAEDSGLYSDLVHIGKTNYEYQLNKEQVEAELEYLLLQNELAKGLEVSGVEVDLNKSLAKINYRLSGFYVPMNLSLHYDVSGGEVTFRFRSDSYGQWNMRIFGFAEEFFFRPIIKEKTVVLKTQEYLNSRFLIPSTIRMNEIGLLIQLNLQLPMGKELIEDMRLNLEDKLTEAFYGGTQAQKTALSWVYEYERKETELLPLIYEDFHQGAEVIRELLVLAKPDLLTRIYAYYPELADVINKVQVIEDRSMTIGDSVIEYAQELLKAISFMSTETSMLICYGRPYDYTAMSEVTVDDINEIYQLGLDEETLKNMEFSYTQGNLYVIYDTDEGQYIVSYIDDFFVVDQEEYRDKYKKKTLLNGWFTTSRTIYKEVYDALYTYYEQDVFVRYLKDDGTDAFAIVSLADNYQNLKIVALKQVEERFQVLNDNYSTLKEINRQYQDFNLNLGTKVFETTGILRLNDSTIKSVEVGLRDQGYLGDGESLVYCSFDGLRYISILLSSGEKYIYTVYRSNYLEKVYPLEEALEVFDDIDPLILLQEVPMDLQEILTEE